MLHEPTAAAAVAAMFTLFAWLLTVAISVELAIDCAVIYIVRYAVARELVAIVVVALC